MDDPRTRIRMELARRDWTRQQLAERSGIPYVTLTRKLRADSPLDTDDLAAIASALDMPIADLFTEATA